MTGQRWLDHPLLERIGYYLRRAWAWRRRATRLGLVLRSVVWVSGCVGLLLALVPWVPLAAVAPVAVVAALLPAAFPAGRWTSMLAVAAIGGLAVGLRAAPPERPLPLLAAVAVALYLHHASAALAAQLRTDVVVAPELLRYWLGRVGLVLAGSAVVGVMVAAVPAPVWSVTGHVALGAAAAVVAAAALVWLVRRPGAQAGGGQRRRASHSTAAPVR